LPGGGPMMMAAMMIHRVNVVITAVWSVYLFITCLSIAQDTAEGENEITSWAEVSLLDSMWEGVWAISAILFSGLPVGLLLTVLGTPWPIASPLVILSMFFFFPLVILSMFAEESPVMPFSTDVWRGPFQHTK